MNKQNKTFLIIALVVAGLIMFSITPSLNRQALEGWQTYVYGKDFGTGQYGNSCDNQYNTPDSKFLGFGSISIDGITDISIQQTTMNSNWQFWEVASSQHPQGWGASSTWTLPPFSLFTFTASADQSTDRMQFGGYTKEDSNPGKWDDYVRTYNQQYNVMPALKTASVYNNQIHFMTDQDKWYMSTYKCSIFQMKIDPNIQVTINTQPQDNQVIMTTSMYNNWGAGRGGIELSFTDQLVTGDTNVTKAIEIDLARGNNVITFPFLQQPRSVDVTVTPYLIYSVNGDQRIKRLEPHTVTIPASTTIAPTPEQVQTILTQYQQLPAQPSVTRTITLTQQVIDWKLMGIIAFAIALMVAATTFLVVKKK